MLILGSTAFFDGHLIPSIYTCEGKDRSPPLAWSGVPQGTKSLALKEPYGVDDAEAERQVARFERLVR